MVRRMALNLRAMITLSERCNASKFTRTEIAKRVGVSRPTLWRWERGAAIEKVDHLVKLAIVFGCNPSDINPELRDA